MRPLQANNPYPLYNASPVATHTAQRVQAQIARVQYQTQAQTSFQNYSYSSQSVVPNVSDWAIPNAFGIASVAHQAATLQRAILNNPVAQWGARSAMTQMYSPVQPVEADPEQPVEEVHEHPEPEPEPEPANKTGRGRETIRQKGGRGADKQKAKGGKGSDLIRQKGGRGSDRQVAKGGRGSDRIVQKQGKGKGTSVVKGGKGHDQAVLFAGKNITVIGDNGEVLFQKGNGSKVVRVKNVEDVRVKTKKKVLFQSNKTS